MIFSPKIPYKLVAERSEATTNRLQIPYWCPRKESNLHLILRRDLLCPLSYEGNPKLNFTTKGIMSYECFVY